MSRRRGVGAARGTVSMVVATLAAGVAMVVPPGGGAAAAQPPPEEAVQGSMMFVLDGSRSMAQSLDDGQTRMDAARTAMNTLIDALPVNLHVGLAAYGTNTGNAPEDKPAGCQDVTVLSEVGEVDADAMRDQVAGITPRGFTPIGHSLERAAAELPDTGPRAIVLVSDGIDTCAPPQPCDVATDLAGAGVELAVHTVGFAVDDEARSELECIADETGGEYSDAPDAESLDDLLPDIADRALRHYDVQGDHADGAENLADAEYLAPGQYRDSSVARATPTYYRVHVPDGVTGHFTAVHVVRQGQDRYNSGVGLRLVDYAKRECARGSGFREYGYDGPETAVVSWTSTSDERNCDPGGPHYLEVTWDNDRDDARDRVELVVDLEAPVDGDRGTPADAPVEFTEPGQDGEDGGDSGDSGGSGGIVWGGGSFNEAASLPGTGRYVDRVRYSEYSVYKVWLEWGQALSYQVRFADSEDQAEDQDATAVTELRGPAREHVRDHWWKSAPYRGSAVELEPVSTPVVGYANRDGGDAVRHAARAGWYYVVVKLSPLADGGTTSRQPQFEIAVSVTGSPGDGPRYAALSAPSSAPPVPSTTPSWSPPPEPAAHAGGDGSGDFPWWLAAGAGAVVLLAVAVLGLLRRRATVRGSSGPGGPPAPGGPPNPPPGYPRH